MNNEEAKLGRVRFDEAAYAADLSGKDFDSVYLDSSQSLSHSFLNGTSFKNSAFTGAPIDQTELAEAQIADSLFFDVDFTGSSFIGATATNTIFQRCNFADGEWRKSRFVNVEFHDCSFNYTTVNLCIFDNCKFLGEVSKYLDNRSVNYNVFTRSHFDFFSEDDVVLASNFGLPSRGSRKSLTNYGPSISLEQVCLNSSSGTVAVSELATAIENEFGRRNVHRLKTMRLEFISNIIGGLAKTRNISATSLTYLEAIFSALARGAQSEAEALAAMSVVLHIRSLLFDLLETLKNSDSRHGSALCQAIEIRYERTYDKADSADLARILGELANNDSETFNVAHFSTGSTFIQLAAMQVVSVTAALTAINLALRQVNTTLVQAQHIRSNLAKLFRRAPKSKRNRRKKNISRVPALERSGSVSKEAALLKRAVATHGYKAVLLDDKAEVAVHYVSN